MFKTILDSYKMYLKNLPVIILFALPLLVFSNIEIYFQHFENPNQGITYFIALAVLLLPLISASTDIAVYRKFFKFDRVNPFSCPKTLFIYLFAQIALGLIATLPIFIFKYLFGLFMDNNLYIMIIALFLNMFIGIYFLARFNLILPLIVLEINPGLKTFLDYTRNSYGKWLSVAFLIYLPYIVINYTVSCPYMNMLFTTLFMFVFICFNTAYVLKNKPLMTPAKVKCDNLGKAPAAEAQPAPKPQPKKVESPKAKPEAPKAGPQKEPAKKAARPKKAPKPKAPELKPLKA